MISIVTPSFRQLEWLRLAMASVADQEGVELEHIIQDAGTEGVSEFFQSNVATRHNTKLFVERDAGMYDAVNRGWGRATGDLLAYLNCDEQYLPGALRIVRDFFAAHPNIEVALAGTIVTDAEGRYMCHRQLMVPHPQGVWFRFPVLTSSVFLRRRVIHERGILFDTRWRDLGDFHWMLTLMKNRVPMAICPDLTSAFADTGENMNLKPNAVREKAETDAMIPAWINALKPFWIAHHRLRRLAAGHFNLRPMSYEIYTRQSPERRVKFEVAKPTAVWWIRL